MGSPLVLPRQNKGHSVGVLRSAQESSASAPKGSPEQSRWFKTNCKLFFIDNFFLKLLNSNEFMFQNSPWLSSFFSERFPIKPHSEILNWKRLCSRTFNWLKRFERAIWLALTKCLSSSERSSTRRKHGLLLSGLQTFFNGKTCVSLEIYLNFVLDLDTMSSKLAWRWSAFRIRRFRWRALRRSFNSTRPLMLSSS